MSNRYLDDRGRRGLHTNSNRDTDDKYERRRKSRSRSRSRSRSPHSSSSRSTSSSSVSSSTSSSSPSSKHDRRSTKPIKDEDSEHLAPPPPPIISKVSLKFGKTSSSTKPVQLKLGTPKPTESAKKIAVASAFSNNDSDDEEEEMPAECRMRMRNIGRDTPTSSGPNSFGKTKQGFCDSKKIFEKNLRNMNCD